MPRLHLFELEDQKWFPTALRNYGTDYLRFIANKFDLYAPIVPVLADVLKRSNTNQVVDLASGGGGGWLEINKKLLVEVPDLKVVLTDYYPNIPAFLNTLAQTRNFAYISNSVDARDVPPHLKGVRTQFLSLHHFRPKDVRQILQNAVDSGNSFAAFEAQDRSVLSLLKMLFVPLGVLWFTPSIKPFDWERLALTYLIPIIPLFVFWDGVVSVLRTYSPKELRKIVDSLENGDTYTWEIGKRKSSLGYVSYIVGVKK